MSELVCCTRSPQHKSMMVQGFVSTIPTPKLPVSCAGHLMTQCFISFTIARASLHLSTCTELSGLSMKRERRPTLVPSSGFVVSRRVTGPLSCQSLRTRSLRTLARCTSWVVTSSQTGAGALRPKIPASVAVVLVLRGSSRMVACSVLWEEELAFCMAGSNQWQGPSSSQQLKLFGCAEEPRSKSASGPIACLSSTASPEGDGENTCPTLTCGKNSGKLTTPSAPSLVPQGLEESRHHGGDCCRAHCTTGSTR